MHMDLRGIYANVVLVLLTMRQAIFNVNAGKDVVDKKQLHRGVRTIFQVKGVIIRNGGESEVGIEGNNLVKKTVYKRPVVNNLVDV